MTTHEKLLDAVSDNYSQESKEIFASPQEETPINTQGGGTLRRRLLTTILPTVLLPLAVASTIGINVINSETKSQTLKGVEKTIVITSVLTKNFLDDALNVKELLLASPFVSQNLQAGNKKVEELGLLEKSIEQVEAEFAETKLLNPNPDLNNYLQVIAKKNGLSEIILTEGNGFNVGYNVPSSDFVQSDEKWWQIAAKQGATIIEAKFDESTQTHILELVNSLEDSQTGELLGITKIGVSMKTFNENLGISVGQNLLSSQSLQIINGEDGSILDNFSAEGTTNAEEIVGGATVGQIVQQFSEALNRNDNVTQESMAPFLAALEKQQGITDVMFEAQQTDAKEADLVAERNLLCFEFQGRHFLLTRIPNTKFVVVSSVTKAEIAAKGRKLGTIFGITALILGGVATGIIILLAQRLSDPLAKLLGKVQQVAAGDLDVKAPLEGTQETRILGDSFNNLVTDRKSVV